MAYKKLLNIDIHSFKNKTDMFYLQDDQDVYLLSKVSDIMHALFGTYKETILPIFEQLLPHFVKLLVRNLF